MITLIATLLLYALAFVVLPFGTSWYEIPKVTVTLILIAIQSILFFWHGRPWRRIYIVYLILFSLTLLSLFWQWTPQTFFGNPYRLQGILTLWGLLLWSLVATRLPKTKSTPKFALGALFLTLLIALVGRLDPAGRAVGSIGEANSLGAFSLFLFPQTGMFLSLLPTAIILFVSGSRSAAIGFLAGALIWVGSHRRRLPHYTVIATVILITSLALPFFDLSRTFDSRAIIWRTALAAGSEKPLFGWGVGNIEVGLRSAAEHQQTSLRYQYVDSSHNVLLDWWVQGGLVGLGSFLTFLILSIRGLIRRKDMATLASLYGMLAVMLFNPVSIAILVPFWWCVGRGLSDKKVILSSARQ